MIYSVQYLLINVANEWTYIFVDHSTTKSMNIGIQRILMKKQYSILCTVCVTFKWTGSLSQVLNCLVLLNICTSMHYFFGTYFWPNEYLTQNNLKMVFKSDLHLKWMNTPSVVHKSASITDYFYNGPLNKMSQNSISLTCFFYKKKKLWIAHLVYFY